MEVGEEVEDIMEVEGGTMEEGIMEEGIMEDIMEDIMDIITKEEEEDTMKAGDIITVSRTLSM